MSQDPEDGRPSLILLPGLACDAELFAGQLPALRAWGDVHVSDVHARFGSIGEMARALLDEHSGRHVLVGCSMGGMLAFELMRQAPGRVRAMALLGTTARADTPELIDLRRRACELYAQGRMDEVLRANVLFAFHPSRSGDVALVGRYLAMLRRAGPEQLIRQNHAVMARVDSRPLLPQIGCPVLVACGDCDGLTPPQRSQEIATAVPGALFAQVPAAGHMLTMEQPQHVAGLLAQWLHGLGL